MSSSASSACYWRCRVRPALQPILSTCYVPKGVEMVRAAILGAGPLVPTREEIEEFEGKTALNDEIKRIKAAYPLPRWLTQKLEYRARERVRSGSTNSSV
jgi:hypothetical protein